MPRTLTISINDLGEGRMKQWKAQRGSGQHQVTVQDVLGKNTCGLKSASGPGCHLLDRRAVGEKPLGWNPVWSNTVWRSCVWTLR